MKIGQLVKIVKPESRVYLDEEHFEEIGKIGILTASHEERGTIRDGDGRAWYEVLFEGQLQHFREDYLEAISEDR